MTLQKIDFISYAKTNMCYADNCDGGQVLGHSPHCGIPAPSFCCILSQAKQFRNENRAGSGLLHMCHSSNFNKR